ncbi:sugar transferase [Virgibacillus sp. SK37]|uniref:sugar transferase n=1 Tax=Virgibacillus sp. SK37 TaxID=403957 RepID=UPI0004D1CF66|nr:sugar transferase [Virgibacillus sp. SK37]AIF42546.1 multidrug MFS transporter [Virgibacillus sp. SK37]
MIHEKQIRPEKKELSSYYVMKRIMDICISISLLFLLSPLLLFISYQIIKREGRPVLTRKSCIGKNGKYFQMLYFRTMTNPSRVIHAFPEAKTKPVPIHYYKGSTSIVTPTGRWLKKYKLDKLPQLWNVLKGEMSFIGPLAKETEQISSADSSHLSMRPGLSGLTLIEEVEKSNQAYDEEERFYCKYCSLKLDIRIAWQSMKKMMTN